MDAGFLNFHSEEHFSTLESSYFLDPSENDSGSYDDTSNHGCVWDWERERELNGDVGLIPISGTSGGDFCFMSTSPPSKEDFHKIMCEWQQLVHLETDNIEDFGANVLPDNELETTASSQDIVHKNAFSTDNLFKLHSDCNEYLDNEHILDSHNNGLEQAATVTIKVENLNHCDPLLYNSNESIDSNENGLDIADPMGHLTNSHFDLTKYVNETKRPSGPGPGGKKIDMKNQRYVIDSDTDDSEDDHIDVETISESNNSLILELQQKEPLHRLIPQIKLEMPLMKSEIPAVNQEISQLKREVPQVKREISQVKQEMPQVKVEKPEVDLEIPQVQLEIPHVKQEMPQVKLDTPSRVDAFEIANSNALLDSTDLLSQVVSPLLDVESLETNIFNSINEHEIDVPSDLKTVTPIIQAGDLESLLEQFEATQYENEQVLVNAFTINENQIKSLSETRSVEVQSPIDIQTIKNETTENTKDNAKSKQILDALPQELIKRIKQTSKRKSISIIPPIRPNKKRVKEIMISLESIYLDHDYCISSNSSKKDSGFSSCEEDERSILRNQPTIKTADGKLMVSLLKVNTIKKRKLNLEEYKLRRKDHGSQNSPVPLESENARRLQKMHIHPHPPANMEMKTLVSIGVNTDQSWGRLQEIVRSCPTNFSPNSLITSLVEHLPQVKGEVLEHREDKTIVYLDKNRTPIKTHNKHTQTVIHRRRLSSSSSCSSRSSRSASRSPSPRRRKSSERVREVEERRVIYIGRIGDTVKREDLKRRFQQYGPITNVSVHFRRTGDNYGFVTFKYKEDAYEAVEHGNDDPSLPQYDLSFGGRRMFCQTNYSDLDNVHDDDMYSVPQVTKEESFDALLREARAKLLFNKRLHS